MHTNSRQPVKIVQCQLDWKFNFWSKNEEVWGTYLRLFFQIWQPTCQDHLVKPKYAFSSRSKAQNSRKWPKTSFLALWIIQQGISVIFEWSSMGVMRAHLSRSFSTIIICNLKSIRCTKLKKMTKNLIFGSLDHSKRHFLWCLNDPAWRIWQSTCHYHLVESKYATWSVSDAPNSRKWSKTSFLAIWIIQKGIFCDVWMIQHGGHDSPLVKII